MKQKRVKTAFLLTVLCGLLLGCGIKSREIPAESTDGEITGHEPYDSLYGKPLIALIETDPWSMVIGADVPTFVMYEKGQIIYKTTEDRSTKIYEVTLTNEEIQPLIKKLIPSDDVHELDEYIEASRATDQPTTTLILHYSRSKVISVYGHLGENSDDRESVPDDFLAVYDSLKRYRNKSASEWLPKTIEVIFWDYNYAPSKRPWIKDFPDLNSPTTIKVDSNSYRVFIDYKDFNAFRKYYKSLGEKEAVEINGRKMAISYRLPFPSMR
jgi:hypothetical protein